MATEPTENKDKPSEIKSDVPLGLNEDLDTSNGYPVWWQKLVKEKKGKGFKAGDLVAVEPKLFKRFIDHSNKYTVHDVPTRTLVFYTGLSAYTENPINLFLRGESSIGKTHNVVQMLRYFPDEDVLMLGGLSPTAIVHDYGVLVDRNGDPIDFSEQPNKRKPKKTKKESEEEYQQRVTDWEEAHKKWNEKVQNARYIVDLHGKVLVFLESPPIETYNRLRPILSHDKEEISYKFTDKLGGQLRTMHVVVKGWPATIFLSTAEEYIEDLATRSFTNTPETHEAKIGDAIRLQGKQDAFPWEYKKEDIEWMLLRGYLGFLRNHIPGLGIVNPFARELAEAYPAVVPRSMRDFKHIRALIKTSALFHAWQRPVICVGEEKHVMCTLKDLEFILRILPEIEETTVTGLPKHILECFHKVMQPLYEDRLPFNYQTLTQKHNEVFRRKRSSTTLRGYIKLLREVGYVDTQPDPTDKRKSLITIIRENEENLFDSVVNNFSKSFSLENLKSWFNGVKNSVGENHVFLMHQINEDNEANIENIYEQHYSPTLLSLGSTGFTKQIFPEGSKQVEGLKPQTKQEETLKTESNRISKTLTAQETLVLLRSSFAKGTQDEFEALAMKTGNLAQREAHILFDRLVDEGAICWFDEGERTLWQWVR